MVDREVMVNNILYVCILSLIVAILLLYDYAGTTIFHVTAITLVVAAITFVATKWYYTGGITSIQRLVEQLEPAETVELTVELAEIVEQTATPQAYGLFNPDGSRITWA